MRLLGASRGGGVERFGQPSAKIDGCSRQNPAYRRSRISKATLRRSFFKSTINDLQLRITHYNGFRAFYAVYRRRDYAAGVARALAARIKSVYRY